MASKKSKKSKSDTEVFPEKGAENGTSDLLVSVENNGVIPVIKAAKRKKKNQGDEVPKKVKKISDSEPEVKKVKKKKKTENTENEANNSVIKPEKANNSVVKPEKTNNPVVKAEKANNTVKPENIEETTESQNWPESDLTDLINRMETNIPEKDNLAYKSRVEKLNWDNVAFKNYSGEECKKTWLQIQKRIRSFRLLKELLNDAKEWITAPKSNHKLHRPKKHPDYPRRPLSSYLLFYLKKKDDILREHPGLDRSELTKKIAEIYKTLPPEKKEKYEKQANANKQEYSEKLQIFFLNHPEFAPPPKLKNTMRSMENVPKLEKLKVEKPKKIDKPKIRLKKEKKVLGRPPKSDRPPKKFQTPFGLFYNSELKNMDEGADKALFKEKCKEQYKQMSDKKKMHWINLAEEDLLRYQEEAKAYKLKYPDYKPFKVKSILTKREKASKERASGKPMKPPNSAYTLFSRDLLVSPEIKSVHPKDRMIFIANKWKHATEEEQNIYKAKVETLMTKYKEDYQTYFDSLPEEERRKTLDLQDKKKKRRASSESPSRSRKPKRKSKPTEPKTKFTEPEQPPISACKYFASVYDGEGDAVQAWKALSADEKKKYEEELVKKKQAYIVEFERFLKSLSKDELEAFSKSRQQQVPSEEEDSSECSDEEEEYNSNTNEQVSDSE